jgi:hypothetical protein
MNYERGRELNSQGLQEAAQRAEESGVLTERFKRKMRETTKDTKNTK